MAAHRVVAHFTAPVLASVCRRVAVPRPRGGGVRRGDVDHRWPQPLPPAWTGQLGPTQPLRYLQVQPTAVVEIEVDTAYEHQRWRHLVRYLRLRPGLSVYDVPLHLP